MTDRFESPESAVPRLARLSLEYCIEQDRLLLSGEDEHGKTMKFWFTARLLAKLIPHLTQRQGALAARLGHDGPDSYRATTQRDGAAAVVCNPSSSETLITSIEVTGAVRQVVLMFKDSSGAEKASLTLSAGTLEKWIQGLRQCFEQAQWPQAVFIENAISSSSQMADGVTIH